MANPWFKPFAEATVCLLSGTPSPSESNRWIMDLDPLSNTKMSSESPWTRRLLGLAKLIGSSTAQNPSIMTPFVNPHEDMV
mmetsp:Transcript_6925/g.13640  ORF Transcript_6925/g.13640 Transcript_6925/m.13640 type:complete len:81 (+) Transcript_6925:104-346(+)